MAGTVAGSGDTKGEYDLGSAFEGLACEGEGANVAQNVDRKPEGKF